MKKIYYSAIFFLIAHSAIAAEISSSFKKVLIVVLENTNYDAAMKQPYLASLVKRGALLSNHAAVTHPSQPNYIAMVAGDFFKVKDNSPGDISASHIGDLLEAKGFTWKIYAENYPGGCFFGENADGRKYARKHNPFISFYNIQQNKKRCEAVMADQKEFDVDIEKGQLPNYAMYVPNQDNDGHDTGITFADQWLKNRFEPLLASKKISDDTLFIVTFDENGGLPGNQIYTVLLGSNIIPGSVVKAKTDHYSILKMIEDNFKLGNLGQNDSKAATITGIWK